MILVKILFLKTELSDNNNKGSKTNASLNIGI